MQEAQSQKEPVQQPDLFSEEKEEEAPAYYFEDGKEGKEIGTVYKMPDGSYEWIYEMDMKKNKSILRVVLIAVGASMIPIVLMLLFLSFRDGFDPMITFITAVCFLAVILISLLCYWFVGVRYRWSYYMVYRMDEEGITFRQVKEQGEKTEAMGRVISLLGAASGSMGAFSAGVMMTDNSARSEFKNVKRIKINRFNNLINVISPFLVNMVYVSGRYYDFVLDYIASHCPDAPVQE